MDSSEIQEPGSSKVIHTVQPLRDLESNWSVNLAKSLEDYLLKICSGEITGNPDVDDAHFNFAEAALLLQGSIQVYSRKVEYLYNLVLHALEFISQTRSQEHAESTSAQPEASCSRTVHDEDDQFWVVDEIPVDAKNCLDNVTSKDTSLDHFVKPPANLVVLEGESLDSTGNGGELESYLLATNNLYRDFILLDPCDAVAVDAYLNGDKSGEGQLGGYRGSSLISKAHKSFMSPANRQSGGTARKSSAKKGHDANRASPVGDGVENPNFDFEPGPNFFPDNVNDGFESDDHHSQHGGVDDSDADENDPWIPLNPHEPGNLKVKPFRKVKVPRRFGVIKRNAVNTQFPLAKLHGTINPELTQFWEKKLRDRKKHEEDQPPPLYEKLRNALVDGGSASQDTFIPSEDGDDENVFDDGINDFDQPDFDMPDVTYMYEGATSQPDKHDDFAGNGDTFNTEVNEDPNSQASLEDLCRAHLDSLLASIAESEKQSELAARVSTWKHRIEHDLEDEDSQPPFDIHEYGETIIGKLSLDEGGTAMSFTDVVKGQEKRDIARTFSALLQLVNDRKVDLERRDPVGESFCYDGVNPFHVRLVSSNDKGAKKTQFQPTKKRQKSSINRGGKNGEMDGSGQPLVVSPPSSRSKSKPVLAQPNCKMSVKKGKNGGLYTPDGKRRRKSRLVESVDMSSAR